MGTTPEPPEPPAWLNADQAYGWSCGYNQALVTWAARVGAELDAMPGPTCGFEGEPSHEEWPGMWSQCVLPQGHLGVHRHRQEGGKWGVPYRWNVRAAFRNGGKAAVTLEEGAGMEEVQREVLLYLRRGATSVQVERHLT